MASCVLVHGFLREFDAAVVDIAHQLDTWIQAFPSHRAGLTTPLQPSPAAPRSNEFPGCPSIFQSGCICCGRLVSASNMQACIVNEGDQTLHELGAAPVVFRPLVEIDHQS